MVPDPIQIIDWHIAEANAARWMEYWGYSDASVTGGGADGGVDVISTGAIAQVKFKAAQVGGPDMQRLAGAGFSHPGKKLMFFTGTSYSTQALAVAERAQIALFFYGLDGAVSAINRYAQTITAVASSTSTGNRPVKPFVFKPVVLTLVPTPVEEPKGRYLGVWFLLALAIGLVCFFTGLNSPDDSSGFREFLSSLLLIAGLGLLFVAWVLWDAIKEAANRSDT